MSIATYQRIGSKRKYGVEIETSSCRLREELRQLTHFGCKSDPTVHGAEFDSPILYGDEGFEHIKDFLTFAEARRWGVNSTCGCHTHYDMRDESEEKLYRIACAYRWTYKMWKRCVSRRRRDNSYCRPPVCSISEIVRNLTSGTVFAQFACNRDRYEYFNLYAYQCHKTFEIRLLEGTLDPDVICNWIAVHCRFMDCVRNLTIAELRDTFDCTARRQYRAISSMIGDDSLMDWVADRARYTGRFPVRGPDCSRS
ncbi:MAG: amidoligase family protein [Planctomycetota bacterium]